MSYEKNTQGGTPNGNGSYHSNQNRFSHHGNNNFKPKSFQPFDTGSILSNNGNSQSSLSSAAGGAAGGAQLGRKNKGEMKDVSEN